MTDSTILLNVDSAAKPPGFETEKTWKKVSRSAGAGKIGISFWEIEKSAPGSVSGGIKGISRAL
jgi:hypothetical protein